MSENEPSQRLKTERSPQFRRIFSNHFHFRFASGDGNITFSQLTDTPNSTHMDVITEEINITMSWSQLKMLGEYIMASVREFENEIGPIPSTGLSREELQKQASVIVKGFGVSKR